MNAEDRLRALLREESTTIVPAGDGLARIQERVARKRRLRIWLLPSAALATAAATAAFLVLGPATGPTTLTQQPGASSAPSAQPAPQPGSYEGPAVWPFTSTTEASAWRTTAPWATDKKELVRRFATDLLGLTSVTTATTCESCDVVQLRVAGALVGEVSLGRYTFGTDRVYTVTSVDGGDLTITRPEAGTAIASPTSVSGRIMGVDENVQLRLVTKAGKEIAQAGAPAGSEVPWQGSLSWTDTDWTHGAIVGTTTSPKDDSLNRLTVLAVVRATGATTSGASFVGLVDGHVSLFDATTGQSLKQLTFPPAGKADTGAAWSSGSLLWVRSQQIGCNDELNRLDNGIASTVLPSGKAHLGWPQLSPDARVMAWVETPCIGGDPVVVVRTADGTVHRHTVPTGQVVSIEDVGDDGASLVRVGTTGSYTERFVGPTAVSTENGVPLLAAKGCSTTAGALDGTEIVTWEICPSGVRLLRFHDAESIPSRGPQLAQPDAPEATSVRDGSVLVWLAGGDTVGEIARYHNGTLAVLIANSGCTSAGAPPGCVRSPDW